MVQTESPAPTLLWPSSDTDWSLSSVNHVTLEHGERLSSSAAAPLWMLLRTGTVDLSTGSACYALKDGDAVLLPAWIRREVVATSPTALILADLSASPPWQAPLMLPGFASRQGGVVALLDACPSVSNRDSTSWAHSYAGLMGAAVTTLWRDLHPNDPDQVIDSHMHHDRLVSAVIAEITRHPGADWNVDRMASLVHLSRSSLSQHFRQTLQISPTQVLRQVRMREARLMLADPSRSVTQIAFAVGYNSTAAFSRAFSGHHGVAPQQWRTSSELDHFGRAASSFRSASAATSVRLLG